MSVDYYMACKRCEKGLHIAQDGFPGFTFYSGQEDTMKLLGSFLSDHSLCGEAAVFLISEHEADDREYALCDSHGVPYPDDPEPPPSTSNGK